MLRSINTLCIILFCCNALAQNWQLFPVSQLSHYNVETDEPSVRSFKCDSVVNLGESNIHFFIRYMGPSEDCYWQNFKWMYDYGTDFTIDSLVYENNSVTYFFLESDYLFEFVFKPFAQPGDEWNLSSQLDRKGTCISAGVSEIFGVSDSIKTYSLQTVLGEVEFILSKSHGLIQFIPFTYFFHEIPIDGKDEFSFPDYELIGLQNDHELKGFKMPGFSEYFHLSAGDQLLWKHTFYETIDYTTNYYRDSLLSSLITEDSVTYEIVRDVYDLSGQLLRIENTISTYKRLDYEYILQTPARWYATDNEVNNDEIHYIQDMKLEFPVDDTIYHKEFIADGCFFDWTNDECLLVCIDAFYQTEYKVSSREGLTYYSGFYGDELELFGSIINGQVRGSMNIPPVGIEQTSENPIHVFPNPTSGILNLTSNGDFYSVDIYNYLGVLIYAGTLVDQIDLSDQTPGLYQLVAFSKSGERYIQAISLY